MLGPRGLQSHPDAVSTQCLREARGPSPAPPLDHSAKPAFISILHPVECRHLGFRAPFFEKRNQGFLENWLIAGLAKSKKMSLKHLLKKGSKTQKKPKKQKKHQGLIQNIHNVNMKCSQWPYPGAI